MEKEAWPVVVGSIGSVLISDLLLFFSIGDADCDVERVAETGLELEGSPIAV
jgi:hypothetical protein